MISFTGDLYIGANNIYIDKKIRDSLSLSQRIVSNFENVFLEDGFDFRKDKESILFFEKREFDSYISSFEKSIILTLGNNHLHDLGEDGIRSTVDFLKNYQNISSTGIGTYRDVTEPLLIYDDGKKISLLAVSTADPEVMSVLATNTHQGVLSMYDSKVAEIIESYKAQVDYFVVLPHWGREYVSTPSVQQRKLAYRWIEAGADLVIGHHAHIIQGKEQYKGKWIYYSLGNYIFPEFYYKNGAKHSWSVENSESIILNIRFDDVIKIEESGAYFNVSENVLYYSKEALNNFIERSSYLNLEKYSHKVYYGIWQKELFLRLKEEYSIKKRILRFFPLNRDYGRLTFFLKRVINKLYKKNE
jgi:hypothetical protein